MLQDCASSNKIKENKYKILRMSLLLGSDENKVETINNFEDAAREIDAMNDETYLKDLEGKFYDTTTLEDEEKKLAVLVDYIGGRVEQRISLLTDFANVTGFDLQNLPSIKYYDKLDDYKDRLRYIREYLDNVEKLDKLNEEVKVANENLEKAYNNKASFEEFNLRNEGIVFNKFQHAVSSLDYLKGINEDNVEDKLNEIMVSVEESKKSLDIFSKSFVTLTNSGISKDEENEYRSYVTSAQGVYYANKEKEFFIRLYQLFMHKESDYASLLVKRDCVNDLLYERMGLRRDLNIQDNDLLSGMYDLLERQYEDIQQQRGNIEQIEELSNLIQSKKDEISQLELDNQKVEILALLREYHIIDTYSEDSSHNVSVDSQEDVDSVSSFDDSENNLSYDDNNEDEAINSDDSDFDVNNSLSSDVEQDVVEKEDEVYADNQVVSVENVGGIDLDLVRSKANKVMQRVGEMLGIKAREDKVVNVISNEIENNIVDKDEVVTNEDKDASLDSVSSSELDSVTSSDNVSDDKEVSDLDIGSNDKEVSDSDFSLDNNFWFPSETPDALNELPDLDVKDEEKKEDNFFNNNPISDFNFPDLKVNFDNNDTEA